MNKIILNSDQKTIHIRDVTIEDVRAHKLLSCESTERVEQKLRDALTIGIIALDRSAALTEADWVTQRLEQQILHVNYMLERRVGEVMTSLTEQLDPSRAGSLLVPVTDLVQRTQREINQQLQTTLSAIQVTQKAMGKTLEETFDTDSRSSHIQLFLNQVTGLSQRLESALDPSREGTVLREFLKRFNEAVAQAEKSPLLQEKIDGLRDEMKAVVTGIQTQNLAEKAFDEEKASLIDASPSKGLYFEDLVLNDLRHIAEVRNDLVEVVGTQPGKGTSKKGDLLYYISSIRSRIVFELKDYGSSKFTFAKIKGLMDDSRANRDAPYGVFLVKNESCLPEGIGRFYMADDFIIATHEFVEIATKVAIMMTHQKLARMVSQEGPDWMSIEMNIEEMKTTLEELSDLESSCATASKAITKTSDGIRRVSRNLTEKIESLLAEFSKKEAV